jgi:hypothetical protein
MNGIRSRWFGKVEAPDGRAAIESGSAQHFEFESLAYVDWRDSDRIKYHSRPNGAVSLKYWPTQGRAAAAKRC